MATRKPPKKPTTKPKARKGAKAKPGKPKAAAKQVGRQPAAAPKPLTPPPPPAKGNGRPSKRTQAITDLIVSELSKGIVLTEICRSHPELDMPAPPTVYEWAKADPELSRALAQARAEGEQAILEECLAIADDARNDWMERLDKEGQPIGWQLNGDHVRRSALRIDTRLKILAIFNPKRFGPKLDVDANVRTEIVRKVFRKDGGKDGQQ